MGTDIKSKGQEKTQGRVSCDNRGEVRSVETSSWKQEEEVWDVEPGGG